MKWIHQTVTSNPKYSGSMNGVEGTCLPPSASPPNVQHYNYVYLSPTNLPLRLSSLSGKDCSNSVWQGECQTACVSLGTIAIVARNPPTSAYIRANVGEIGSFFGCLWMLT